MVVLSSVMNSHIFKRRMPRIIRRETLGRRKEAIQLSGEPGLALKYSVLSPP